jgi:hypothetical protein
MTDVLGVHRVEIAFAQTQVVDGIQEIGLPHPVVSDKAIDAGRKRKLRFFHIFKIDKRQ